MLDYITLFYSPTTTNLSLSLEAEFDLWQQVLRDDLGVEVRVGLSVAAYQLYYTADTQRGPVS